MSCLKEGLCLHVQGNSNTGYSAVYPHHSLTENYFAKILPELFFSCFKAGMAAAHTPAPNMAQKNFKSTEKTTVPPSCTTSLQEEDPCQIKGIRETTGNSSTQCVM